MAVLPGSTTVFTIRGPLGRPDLPGLCARLRTSLERSRADVALCDLDDLVEPDLVSVDALARLELAARRMGCGVRLRAAPRELDGLLAFVGLERVIPRAGLCVETRRQAEKREELLRVEEERELDDPPG
jgi:ABC-type transporter Mla MlaB component